MSKKHDEQPLIKPLFLLALIPLSMFGLLGGVIGSFNKESNFLSGSLWGIGIGVAMFAATWIWMSGWEWIKKEADKGKLFPYLLVGFAVAIAISGYLATNLGSPSCEETGDPPYSTCTQYADNGFEATENQKWDKFWSTLPVTVIITSLIAVIVRNEMQKSKKD